MKEPYIESTESTIGSLMRRVTALEHEVKQWRLVVLSLSVSVMILTISLIVSKL